MKENGAVVSDLPIEPHKSVKVPITLNTSISSPSLVVKELPTTGQGGSMEIHEQGAPVYPPRAKSLKRRVSFRDGHNGELEDIRFFEKASPLYRAPPGQQMSFKMDGYGNFSRSCYDRDHRLATSRPSGIDKYRIKTESDFAVASGEAGPSGSRGDGTTSAGATADAKPADEARPLRGRNLHGHDRIRACRVLWKIHR